jgi:formimidoylglutamate deiminase
VGRSQAGIAVGALADLVVLEPDHPRLLDHGEDTLLDAFVFGSADRGIAQVIAGGRHVVKDGRHVDRDRAFAAYRRTMKRLLSA